MAYYYLLLLISVICGTVSSIISKLYQKRYVAGFNRAFFMWLILPSILMVFFFLCLIGFKPQFGVYTIKTAFLYALIAVVAGVAGTIAIRIGKLSIYIMTSYLGAFILPFLYGVLFLDETVTAARIAGAVILTVSLFVPFISFKRASEDDKTKKKSFKIQSTFAIICLCMFILTGGQNILMKSHQINPAALKGNQFAFWLYSFMAVMYAAIYGIFMFIKFLRSDKFEDTPAAEARGLEKQIIKPGVKNPLALGLIFACSAIGVVFFLLNLVCAKNLPASSMFPIIGGGTIVLAALAGRIFFKEKLTPQICAGLGLTIIGIILVLF